MSGNFKNGHELGLYFSSGHDCHNAYFHRDGGDFSSAMNKIPITSPAVLYMVIGTICVIALTCILSLAYMAIFQIEPAEAVFGALKDATTFILGALTGVLVNTRNRLESTTDEKRP